MKSSELEVFTAWRFLIVNSISLFDNEAIQIFCFILYQFYKKFVYFINYLTFWHTLVHNTLSLSFSSCKIYSGNSSSQYSWFRFFFFISLSRSLSILLIFSKNLLLDHMFLFHWYWPLSFSSFFFSFSIYFALLFLVSWGGTLGSFFFSTTSI